MEEKTLLEGTLIFPVRPGKVLLGMKMLKIGKDRWNGYGGGVEAGDVSIEDRAVLELEQEAGIVASPKDLVKVAVAYFHNTKTDGTSFIAKVHVYLLYEWDGEPFPTKEMSDPTLFSVDTLPLEKMMLADREWVPRALSGEKMLVFAKYGPFQKELIGPVVIVPNDLKNVP